MYVAVVMLILGQGLLFSSVQVLEYGSAVWVGFFLFIVIYEEPARTVTVSLPSVAGQLGAGYAILMLMYQHSFGRTSLHSGGCWELSAHPLARHHPPVSLATTE